MTSATLPTPTAQTLTQRLAEAKISAPEALRYALILADALRRIHDAGQTHGSVSPSAILLTGTGLELMPPAGLPDPAAPYTAPEVAAGAAADARSDIFSFGAVVYEMLAGGRAFEGGPTPAVKGGPAVDRFLGTCLAKDPAARPQRMQKVILELKLLSVAARRCEAPAPVRAEQVAAIQAEMRQMEARVAARLEEHEASVSELDRAAGDALNGLRDQISAVGAQLAAAQEQTARTEQAHSTLGERLLALVEQSLEGVSQRLAGVERNIEALGQRLAAAESSYDALREHSAALQENVAADFHDFGQALKTQSAGVESVRSAMAQTDDLVERVVEALELLQASVIEQAEERGVVN
jgi:hypothetical protein